jgi:hypothetical protein
MTFRKTRFVYGLTENKYSLWTQLVFFNVKPGGIYDYHCPLPYYENRALTSTGKWPCSFMTRNLFHSSILRDWMCFWLLSYGSVYSALCTTSKPKRIARYNTTILTVRPLFLASTSISEHTIQWAKASLATAQCLPLSPWYSEQLVKELFLYCLQKKQPSCHSPVFGTEMDRVAGR